MQKSLHLCSVCLHQWRVPQLALKYRCDAPPPPARPSLGDRPPLPPMGARRVLCRKISRGWSRYSWLLDGFSTSSTEGAGEGARCEGTLREKR